MTARPQKLSKNIFTKAPFRILILLLFFILLNFTSNISFAQKQFNNWYCNKNVAFTFNTPDGKPRAIYDNKMEYGSPASISDANGNLLFYTDGTFSYSIANPNANQFAPTREIDLGDILNSWGWILNKK